MKGRSSDPEALITINEALLCKAFGCTPSQLRKEKIEDLEKFMIIYAEMAKQNPLFMFM